MPSGYMPAKRCPLTSGPAIDCTGWCALYDHEEGACAILAMARAVHRSASGADRDALLALADDMDGRLDEYDANMHGVIYMANEMRKYARRIREALGVVGDDV